MKERRVKVSFAVEREMEIIKAGLKAAGQSLDEEIIANIARCRVSKRKADMRRNARLLREQPFNQIRLV